MTAWPSESKNKLSKKPARKQVAPAYVKFDNPNIMKVLEEHQIFNLMALKRK
jgi:hypothetical protein